MTGVVFTAVAMAAAIVNLILLSGITGRIMWLNTMGGVAAFATSIGAGFLGWAALRARVLPPWVAVTLIVIGLVTIPILFATPLSIGPDWATDFLAFLVSGIAYAVVGVTLLAARKRTDENAGGASASTATQAK